MPAVSKGFICSLTRSMLTLTPSAWIKSPSPSPIMTWEYLGKEDDTATRSSGLMAARTRCPRVFTYLTIRSLVPRASGETKMISPASNPHELNSFLLDNPTSRHYGLKFNQLIDDLRHLWNDAVGCPAKFGDLGG